MAEPSMFRTQTGQERYFAAYEKTLSQWPIPVQSFSISTGYGATYVNACGPNDNPPLILLPGAAVSSTMWYCNVEALSKQQRVFALDIPGEMGKSVNTYPDRKSIDYALWIKDVLDQLEITNAAIAGLSLGGFISLRIAIDLPERISKLILMSPAGVLSLPPTLFLRMLAAFLPISFSKRMKLLFGAHSPRIEPVIQQMMTRTDFRYKMFLPSVLSNKELKKIDVPSILLMGKNDSVYKPERMVKRIKTVIPEIKVEIIENAGHALPLDQPEVVNKLILEFLNE